MRRPTVIQTAFAAFCIAINIAGAYLALMLKLPIYLDSIGTVLAGAMLGPWYGMAAGIGSALISGVTSDVYALYFMPAGMVTGMMAGLLFKTRLMKGARMPFGTFLLTVPGTLISSCISAFLFGGVTSSGSSILVQILKHLGFNLVASAFVVQIVTDYADRFISAALAAAFIACLTGEMKMTLKGGHFRGTV